MLLSGSVVEVEIDFEMQFQLVKRGRWQADLFLQGMLVWTTTSFAQNKHLTGRWEGNLGRCSIRISPLRVAT